MSRIARTTATMAALFMLVLAGPPAIGSAQTATPNPNQVPGPTVHDPLADLTEPGARLRLSDETKVTRWANSNANYPIRTAPSSAGRTITRLHYLTEDGFPEVYVVLDAFIDSSGDPWLHIRIPMKPNGRTGWVPADYLTELHVVRTHLVVSLGAKRATLFKNGRKIFQAPVGIGKVSTPTPTGIFWIRELLRGDGQVYGPWAFGTSAYAAISDWHGPPVVGIHGTNEPNLIPGRPSHGCIRMRNDKIKKLVKLMPIGTPVDIVR